MLLVTGPLTAHPQYIAIQSSGREEGEGGQVRPGIAALLLCFA
jgi:hypothetical protein